MIPKVIHYCWFGGNSKPELVQKCIESWKQYCPEYKIVEWNESNFDVNCIDYVKCAYQDKKWAFVFDYARLWIIYNNGGIYLDTDVLLKNNLDDLLSYDCWLASDDVRYIATGLGFGAVKNHYIIEKLMNEYSNYEYPSGTNVSRDTKVLENLLPNWRKSDTNQIFDGILIIGLKDYGKWAKHLYMYTWADSKTHQKRIEEITNQDKLKFKNRVVWKIKCIARTPKLISYMDRNKGKRIEKIYTFLAYDFLDNGALFFLKRMLKKIF